MLISDEYRELNRVMHETKADYGTGSYKWAGAVQDLSDAMESRDILDYGCGKGYLSKFLPFDIKEYDPAIEGKNTPPDPADIVVCSDVLEHIEPDCMDAVLDDLKRLVKRAGFFVISTRPAIKHLPDGRNAHISLHNTRWWMNEIWQRFDVLSFNERGDEFVVTVMPLGNADA